MMTKTAKAATRMTIYDGQCMIACIKMKIIGPSVPKMSTHLTSNRNATCKICV